MLDEPTHSEELPEVPKDYVTIAHDGTPATTTKAVLINFGDSEEWIPKSQIHDLTANEIIIPQWLAKKKGLI